MDWPELFKALGYALAAVIGAVGLWAFRLIPVRAKAGIDTREADARIATAKAASDRKARKEAIDEYRELLEVQRVDAAEWRKQVHEVRGENGSLASKLAVQEFYVKQLTARVDECEADRREMREMIERQAHALARAGIVVEGSNP